MADPVNSYALVTGGSSGIGLAIAHELAAKGYNIVLVSNQANQLQSGAVSIREKSGVDCITLVIDLADPTSAETVHAFCLDKQLYIEVLVNNAGMLIFSEVVDVPLARVQTIMNLHMHTPVMLCRLFGADMATRRRGYILNVSSISAVMAYPGISLYGPTKTFLRQFTRAFRYEMDPYGVSVCAVLPGATETALYDPNKVNVKLAKRLGVMQTPERVARIAVRALFRGSGECIPGWLNKLTVWFLPVLPAFVIRAIYRKTDWLEKGKKTLG